MVRNEWLDEIKSPAARYAAAWHRWNDGSDKESLRGLLREQARLIAGMCKQVTTPEMADDAAEAAYEKADKLDPEKADKLAFNYFTTVILCHLRQLVRGAKRAAERWTMKRLHRNTLTRGLKK